MRPLGRPEQLEKRRVRALALLQQGWMPVDVARTLNVDRRSVRRWRAAHDAQGRAGLRAKPVPGRPCKLSVRQRERLRTILLNGAIRAGYRTDLWTCARVTDVITERFGVDYHVNHVGRLLGALGFSPQKPERRARERDEDAIRTWVRSDWPRVKKTPRG
jgi:transposase